MRVGTDGPNAAGGIEPSISLTTGQKTKKKVPKVRSYVRPTQMHTPKPKKKPKYPDREVEEELGDSNHK